MGAIAPARVIVVLELHPERSIHVRYGAREYDVVTRARDFHYLESVGLRERDDCGDIVGVRAIEILELPTAQGHASTWMQRVVVSHPPPERMMASKRARAKHDVDRYRLILA
jgi:hypothetical protein